jgi:hypothetical protein
MRSVRCVIVNAQDEDDSSRYGLLALGVLLLLSTASYKVAGNVRRERRRLTAQSIYNDKLRTALVALANLVERISIERTPPAIAEVKDDLLDLIIRTASELLSERATAVCYYELDTSAFPHRLRRTVVTPPGALIYPRPVQLLPGSGWSDQLFSAIRNRATLLVRQGEPARRMPLWDSSGSEYSAVIAAAVAAAGKEHGLLVACVAASGRFALVDCDLMRILAAQLANGLSAASAPPTEHQ